VKMSGRCGCGACVQLEHPFNTEEERAGAVWGLYGICTKLSYAGLVVSTEMPIAVLPHATGLDHVMRLLHGDGNQDATDGAAAVICCLASSKDLPEGYGTKWRADTIAPLMKLLRHSSSRRVREWSARALELQTLDQESRAAMASESGMVYYNCAAVVAKELQLKNFNDRIAIRKGLKALIDPAFF